MAGYRVEFDWDQRKEASNRAKHGLPFELAVTVFRDPFAATILDDGQGSDEERWITVGEAADASSCWRCTLGSYWRSRACADHFSSAANQARGQAVQGGRS